MNEDSALLLGHCDAGIKMAVESMNIVLPAVEDPALRKRLSACRNRHLQLQKETGNQLRAIGAAGKDPNPMARAMNWMKSNATLTFKPGDPSVADLMVSGCNMGVKNLHKYQNKYAAAAPSCKNIADQLIGLEADLASDLYPYL